MTFPTPIACIRHLFNHSTDHSPRFVTLPVVGTWLWDARGMFSNQQGRAMTRLVRGRVVARLCGDVHGHRMDRKSDAVESYGEAASSSPLFPSPPRRVMLSLHPVVAALLLAVALLQWRGGGVRASPTGPV